MKCVLCLCSVKSYRSHILHIDFFGKECPFSAYTSRVLVDDFYIATQIWYFDIEKLPVLWASLYKEVTVKGLYKLICDV